MYILYIVSFWTPPSYPMREDIKSSKGQVRILQLKDVTVTPQVKLMVRSYGYTNGLFL